MFEVHDTPPLEHPAPGPGEPVDAATLARWATELTHLHEPAQDDAERIDKITALETLQRAAAAAQAELTADFDQSMREKAESAGVPRARQGRGIAEQIALARRESPHRGKRHLGLAVILRREMPHTREAFRAGRITEWSATLLARETACLELADRRRVDAEIAGDTEVESLSEKQIAATGLANWQVVSIPRRSSDAARRQRANAV